MVAVPDGYADLLERPLLGHLATTRPDGSVQVNPMWFDWDGERLRFTHTAKRQKYRNVRHDPRVAVSIADPDNPYRYLELRGVVEGIEEDPSGAYYVHLAERYNAPWGNRPPPDAADRVVFLVRPTGSSTPGRPRPVGRQARTRRAIAAEASAILAVASSPPAATASLTQ
jgi:PPOX class probable F420-dependent enzyme